MIFCNLVAALFATALTPTHATAPAAARIGNATYTFTDRNFASLFDQTLVLGHTISADFMVGMISRSVGPGTVLAQTYAQRPVLANLAEPRTMSAIELNAGQATLTKADCLKENASRSAEQQALCATLLSESRFERWIRKFRAKLPMQIGLETGFTKIYRWIYQVEDESVPSHRLDFMNRVYNASTAIVGIDALYLDATESFNTCADVNVHDVLDDFLGKAHRDGKIVILGNVPKDDYSTFTFLNRLAIFPQIESCRKQLNDALAATCRTERNCYVVDLEGIVSDLARDGYLTLNDGTRISAVQTRPDGVNLSPRGTQYVVEKILAKLAQHPPRPVTETSIAPR